MAFLNGAQVWRPPPTSPGHLVARGLAVYGLILSCLSAVAGAAEPPAASAATSTEYQVKAVFLTKFASFVTWPDSVFADAAAPIAIGVLGSDPFGASLREAARGEVIRGRRLTIRSCDSLACAATCQIVFASEQDPVRLESVLAALRLRPVLTVGDAPGFARAGGAIGMVRREGRVRLEINPVVAERVGLVLAAKLLGAATVVR